ncbi:MAG: methyltransferase domain-containing protein, partial [Anaerolineae bacterium]
MIFKGIELCCPDCRGDLTAVVSTAVSPEEWACADCGRRYPVIAGIPDLRVFPDPYIEMEPDRDKGRMLAEAAATRTFPELVDFYYQHTDVVPPQHARLYKRGLLAAEARSKSVLAAWQPSSGHLLDVGCGTGPMLAAAAAADYRPVGVDIAFRWLVVGQRRLQDAGVDAPLICACAEALPFPDGAFTAVTAESVLEHV